ncbi:hypothetical protein PHMEG_00014497 [Phytophthora megakarya]|uniref:Uncharacterized protein n=1 Tax=Phytophthora megakarya TaxID=4795 RepID=A0A225W3M3_9STRA|nr:hypothetical protein PHMEG_00014497 [Phytophthora megakarya]
MVPWCSFIKDKIQYTWRGNEEQYWVEPRRLLEVYLPTREDMNTCHPNWNNGKPMYPNDEDFWTNLRNIREALALLAAVARIDPSAWKYILEARCNVKLEGIGEGLFEEDIPAEFVLCIYQQLGIDRVGHGTYPDILEEEIIYFCGTDHREHPSQDYLETLKKIATLGGTLQHLSAIDIEIPVRLEFDNNSSRRYEFVPKIFDILHAELAIKEEWDSYNQRVGQQKVEQGVIRCTFVLEPMLVDFGDSQITPEIAGTVKNIVADNCWSSQFQIWVSLDDTLLNDARATTLAFGQIMSSMFDSIRRSSELANTRYQPNSTIPIATSNPLQLGAVFLPDEYTLPACYLPAMHSAMVVNQTTKQLAMRCLNLRDAADNKTWLEWMAYSFFSKRARLSSALESLALIDIVRLTPSDVEAFAAILASEHPEEALFRSPRGKVNERDAILKADVPVRWQFDNEGQAVESSNELIFSKALNCVRTFSDDGESEWVNVLVPGYGRCQVLRSDLTFQNSKLSNVGSGGVTTLKIGFNKYGPSDSSGLPQFLEVIGSSLRSLTLDGPRNHVDTNVIIQNCPNLEELSLWGYFIGIKLDFRKYRENCQHLPYLPCNWKDAGSLIEELSDSSSSWAKCARRLRVRLKNSFPDADASASEPGIYYMHNFERDIGAVLNMLEVNSTLEFIEVIVPDRNVHIDAFRAHHFTPLHRELEPLSETSKLAFLSILLPTGSKKVKTENVHRGCYLNRDVLATIFAFAAVPVRRKVHYREEKEKYWETEITQV